LPAVHPHPHAIMNRPIVLASSSPWRREILERTGLAFSVHAPGIDESPRPGETAPALARRLSVAKAKAVAEAAARAGALIIGCDQVAEHRGQLIGKPDDHDHAVRQLQQVSGSVVTLHSGVALYDADAATVQAAVEPFVVEFRPLTRALIERYLRAERPYQCCGSLKAEGLGIALLKRLHGDDPNALIGLPMIRLVDMLNNAGVELV